MARLALCFAFAALVAGASAFSYGGGGGSNDCSGAITSMVCYTNTGGQMVGLSYVNNNGQTGSFCQTTGAFPSPIALPAGEVIVSVTSCVGSATFTTDKGTSVTCGRPVNNGGSDGKWGGYFGDKSTGSGKYEDVFSKLFGDKTDGSSDKGYGRRLSTFSKSGCTTSYAPKQPWWVKSDSDKPFFSDKSGDFFYGKDMGGEGSYWGSNGVQPLSSFNAVCGSDGYIDKLYDFCWDGNYNPTFPSPVVVPSPVVAPSPAVDQSVSILNTVVLDAGEACPTQAALNGWGEAGAQAVQAINPNCISATYTTPTCSIVNGNATAVFVTKATPSGSASCTTEWSVVEAQITATVAANPDACTSLYTAECNANNIYSWGLEIVPAVPGQDKKFRKISKNVQSLFDKYKSAKRVAKNRVAGGKHISLKKTGKKDKALRQQIKALYAKKGGNKLLSKKAYAAKRKARKAKKAAKKAGH